MNIRRAIAFIAGVLLLCHGASIAQGMSSRATAKQVTPGEQALLPEWCIDSQDGPYGGPEGGEGLNKSPRARKWVGLMGTDFWHMHHYCRGLRDVLRLSTMVLSPRERVFLQERAVDEFNYLLKVCRPTMPLLPEVLLKKGEIQTQMGEIVGALDSFEASTRLKPDYWPAYDRWLGVLIKFKQYDRAAAVLEQGLAASPGQPNLVAWQKSIPAGHRVPLGQRSTPPAAPASAASS